VFQDSCLRVIRQGGRHGMARLWVVTLLDVVQSVISEYAHKEVEMKKEMKPEDIRMAGGALMLGAAAFVIGIYTGILGDINNNLWTISFIFLVFFCTPLLVVGLLGIRNRYGEKIGSFGKNILLLGVITGSATSLIGFVRWSDPSGANWILFYAGPAVLLAGLAMFGLIALYKTPMPRLNVLPLIAGLWYPLMFFGETFTSLSLGGAWGDPFLSINFALLLLQGIALAALGHILKSDVPQEMTPA
jgi:hypothetical protein